MLVFAVDYSLNKPAMTVYKHTRAANAANTASIYVFPSKCSQNVKNTLRTYNVNVEEQDLSINAPKGDEVQTLYRAKIISNSICNIIRLYLESYPDEPTILLIEGASYNSSGSSYLDLIGAKFVFLSEASELVDEIVSIPPTTIKKHVTGKGNASKQEVIESVSQTKTLKHPIIPVLNQLKSPYGNHMQCVDDIADSIALLQTYMANCKRDKGVPLC